MKKIALLFYKIIKELYGHAVFWNQDLQYEEN